MTAVQRFRMLRALLLLATAGVIAKVFLAGQMALYMSPTLDPLTALTACVLAAMGLSEVRATAIAHNGSSLPPPPAGGTHDHERQHEAAVDQTLTLLVVAVPLVLGLAFVPRALGSAALSGEDVVGLVWSFAPGDAMPAPTAAVAPPPPKGPVEDFADLYGYLRQAGAAGIGQRVHALGVVTRGAGLGSDQFVLLRYSVVHCVADARPVALVVQAPGVAGWQEDQWVAVDGSLSALPLGGEQLVSVLAERIAPIDEPPDPYLPPLL